MTESWDFRVVGININPIQPSDANAASRKLGETLTPKFLEQEFPEEYSDKKSTNTALQCQKIIQAYGKYGWEHYQQGQLGNNAMLYFRRKEINKKINAKLSPSEEAKISKLHPLQHP